MRQSPNCGSALVLVLILLGLVAAMVVQIQLAAHHRTRAAQAALQRGVLQRAATDATIAALHRLADDDNLLVDSTNEDWAATENMTSPDGVGTLVRITDESRFFDLNNLSVTTLGNAKPPSEVLMDILSLCGNFRPSEFVKPLMDWIDTDDRGFRETDFYLKKPTPYAVPNRILYTWNELRLIDGASPELFVRRDRLERHMDFNADFIDCTTVIPIDRDRPLPININTAPQTVLTGVLGLAQDNIVAAVMTMRAASPIRTLDSLALLVDPILFESVRPYLDVRSRFFTIDTRAYIAGQTAQLRVLARRDDTGRVDVLQWVL